METKVKVEDVYIKFSHLQKFVPYEFMLHDWRMAERYKGDYLLFKASFVAKPDKMFKLLLPINKFERAIISVSFKDREQEILKVRLTKRDYGVIDIEVIP